MELLGTPSNGAGVASRRGLAGLRVADASVLPRVTTGNTMAPCVVVGEQAAAFCHWERTRAATTLVRSHSEVPLGKVKRNKGQPIYVTGGAGFTWTVNGQDAGFA
jgi:hypothetical protein